MKEGRKEGTKKKEKKGNKVLQQMGKKGKRFDSGH